MNRMVLQEIPLRTNRLSGLAPVVNRLLFALLLLQFTLVWARLWLPWPVLPGAGWPDGVLLVLTTATMIGSLTRQAPGQNVMLVTMTIAIIASAAQSLGALAGIPFGPCVYTGQVGQQLFYPLPWAVPMIWVTVILSSRGVGRLMLRPWRNTPACGFRLIGLTTALVLSLGLGLEPFATRVKHFWFWNPTRLNWYGTPWISFCGWAVTTLLILAFATPSLINKTRAQEPPPDYLPLVVWLLLNLLFATGAAVHHLWPAVGLISLTGILAACFALRGARCRGPVECP